MACVHTVSGAAGQVVPRRADHYKACQKWFEPYTTDTGLLDLVMALVPGGL